MDGSRKFKIPFIKPAIANRLLSWFLLSALLPLFVFGYIVYNHSVETLRKVVTNDLETIAQRKVDYINSFFKGIEKDLAVLAHSSKVVDSLALLNSALKGGGGESSRDMAVDKELEAFLSYFMEIYGYYDLFLISTSGDIFFTVLHEKDFGTNLVAGPYKDSQLAEVFTKAVSSLKTERSGFSFYIPSQESVTFIALPVFKDGRMLGVVAVQVGAEAIYRMALDYTGLGETGEALIASEMGGSAVFLTPLRYDAEAALKRKVAIGSRKALPIQKAVLGENSAGVYADYRGKKVLAAWRYLPILKVGMVVKKDIEEAFAPVIKLTRWFLLMGIVTMMAGIMIALLLSRTISRPIVKLTETTKKMAGGDLTVKAKIETYDEIGNLARTFNKMIFERGRAEEELRGLRNLLKNIVDSMPSVLVGVDPDGRVMQWNRGAEKATGISSGQAQGELLTRVFPQLAREMDKVRKAIRDSEPRKDEKIPWKTGDELRYADLTIYPLVTDKVQGAVIRVDDVTGRVRMEELMIQTEKMMSVGGLAAGMAHEINNPLAGILQNVQVMRNRLYGDLPGNRRVAEECGTSLAVIKNYMDRRDIFKMFRAIMEAGRRAANIVDNMLSFSRKSDARFALQDLGELLDKTIELASSDYDLKKKYDFRQIKIIRRYDENMPRVRCDATKIKQVFLNILKNGAQAMADETVAMADEKEAAPCFTLAVMPEGNMARIEIGDNGPGMDELIRKRVFEPFFTTKDVGIGTGLGLSVSYFIITENHFGTMEVESVPCAGTKFIIRLPLGDSVSG
ncbi:MAG: HAMP domain-containing protein [Desulfobacteraceae bacterium]|nr:HAMP domain-containing protein [Desulfobacteraceae bacterium]